MFQNRCLGRFSRLHRHTTTTLTDIANFGQLVKNGRVTPGNSEKRRGRGKLARGRRLERLLLVYAAVETATQRVLHALNVRYMFCWRGAPDLLKGQRDKVLREWRFLYRHTDTQKARTTAERGI